MKAIIVIDVPIDDSADFGHLDIRADIVVKAYNDWNGTFKEKQYEHVEVNPVPQRRYSLECGDSDGNRWKKSSEYDMGYNDCIGEILEHYNETDI